VKDTPATKVETKVISHRGLSGGEPENTLEAFEASVARGVEGIELDVRRTADGVLVVAHDSVIEGDSVARSTLAELATLVPGLCRFAEALDVIPQQCVLDVEVKVAGFESEVLDELREKRRRGEYVVTSFRDGVVAKVRQLDPQVRVGLVLGRQVGARPERETLGVLSGPAPAALSGGSCGGGMDPAAIRLRAPDGPAWLAGVGLDRERPWADPAVA
jgi:glycerophosphoryl diester phosphodiesterase